MNITTSQRRKARLGKDLFLSTRERYDAAIERIVETRCRAYGEVYVPQNHDYYNGDGGWNQRSWESHAPCREIRSGIKELVPSDQFTHKVMKGAGFKFLGSGSFRWAYEDSDGLVYKFFNSREYDETRDDNKNDVAASRCWHKSLPSAPPEVRDGFFIPVMRMAYGVVISEKAPPRVENGVSCWGKDRPLDEHMRNHGWMVNDTHGGNMWWDGERWCYVDLGHFRKMVTF